MKFFWVVWGWDALVVAVALYFFAVGIGDGSVSSFNLGLWLLLLLALAGILGGGYALHAANHGGWALGLLSVLALPSLFGALLMLIVLITKPNWQ